MRPYHAVCLRIENTMWNEIKKAADADRRSMANYLQLLIHDAMLERGVDPNILKKSKG